MDKNEIKAGSIVMITTHPKKSLLGRSGKVIKFLHDAVVVKIKSDSGLRQKRVIFKKEHLLLLSGNDLYFALQEIPDE